MHGTSDMRVLRIRGRRANLLFLAKGGSRGLLLRSGFKDRATASKAKARADHLQVADLSGLTASQGKGHASIVIILDT